MTRTSRRAATALCALAALASPATSPAARADEQCEVGKTRYVTESSHTLDSIGVPQSWSLSTGKGVTVAVVDSGVDPANAHLGSAVLPGVSLLPVGPRDGRQDKYGHGTAIAGIIAARYLADKRSALVGAAPAATILPVRVFYAESDATSGQSVPYPPDTSTTAEGIRYAVLHGADVVNVSISTPADDPELPALRSAIALARRKDVVVVASAGNQEDGKAHTERRYPAGEPGVIGVAAANGAGAVDDYSVHGPQVDVSAPGSDVLISYFGNGDCMAGGDRPYTSYATGFVSGLAAQLRQRFPDESAARIAYRIMASADRPREGERDDVEGWGLIQPYDALTMTRDPRRPGPRLPGATPAVRSAAQPTEVQPLRATPDPLAPARRSSVWWALAAAGLAAVALVLRPLAGRSPARRRRD